MMMPVSGGMYKAISSRFSTPSQPLQSKYSPDLKMALEGFGMALPSVAENHAGLQYMYSAESTEPDVLSVSSTSGMVLFA